MGHEGLEIGVFPFIRVAATIVWLVLRTLFAARVDFWLFLTGEKMGLGVRHFLLLLGCRGR